ncbi:ROK family transcriptional regulator [Mariniluteicoccus flavus]
MTPTDASPVPLALPPLATRGAASHGSLFAIIRAGGGITRQELLEASGMSRSTLVARLGELEAAGLVRDSGQRSPTGGRPAKGLCFDDRDKVVLTLDVGQTGATVSLCSLAEEQLETVRTPLDRGQDGAQLIARLSEVAEPLLASHPSARLVGVGLAIPAPVRTPRGDRWPTEAMPDAEHDLAGDLEARFGVPAVVENDARAMALGDHVLSEGPGVFLSLKYASGIGAGVVSDGHILRGSTGAAGDIGHIRIAETGPVCTCGVRGCLAAFTSGRALLLTLTHRGVASLADLVALLDAGDPEVVARVSEAADLLGTHVAALVQALNPTRVTLGGSLGRHPLVFDRLVSSVGAHTMARVRDHAEIVVSPLGRMAGTVGLVRLVTETVFAPERVDALIEARARQAS